MIELFPHISEGTRQQAETAWTIAQACNSPIEAVNFLNNFTNYYCVVSQEEDIREFLNFFFNLKMEELINENNLDQREERER